MGKLKATLSGAEEIMTLQRMLTLQPYPGFLWWEQADQGRDCLESGR